MDTTAIVISALGVFGTIFGSTGFWQWRSTKKMKNPEIYSEILNTSHKVAALSDKVDSLQTRVQQVDDNVKVMDAKFDENCAVTARVRILRFEDEVQEGKHHSKDAWDQCMSDVNYYTGFTSVHPEFENGITGPTCEHLRSCYKERLEKHDW